MRNFFRKRRAAEDDLEMVADTGLRVVPDTGLRPTSPAGLRPGGSFGRGGAVADPPMTGPRPSVRRLTSGGGAADAEDDDVDRVGEEIDRDMPQFRMPVARGFGDLFRDGPAPLPGMTPEVNRALREAFTPTRPKQQVNSLFVGRLNTLRRIIAAIEEERAHVVLFGDRGRGKTSLANAVQQIAGQAGYMTLKLTCSGALTFEAIFRSFLQHIPASCYQTSYGATGAGRVNFNSFDELLPEGGFSVTQLNEILAQIQGVQLLLILDEYDRVTSEDLRNKLAELIKNLTDAAMPITLFVVGVAENVDQLLGKHPSIQRALVAVHLPLMTDREVERIVVAGAQNAGIVFDTEVRRRIVIFAKGLPYYAQLLSLHAARSAVSRDAASVGLVDLAYAVARCVSEAERAIVDAYNRALGPGRDPAYADALYAAAEARADAFGVVDAADMATVPVTETGDALAQSALYEALDRLIEDDHGGVLVQLSEAGVVRYRFRHQMMRQYILMRQAKERGLLD